MGIRVDLDHPANAGILKHLRAGWKRDRYPESASPGQVGDPYTDLGCHPDLVEYFWDKLGAALPRKCRWVLCGRPVLVRPDSGLVFGFIGGTHTQAFRVPEALRAAHPQRVWSYSGGSRLDLDSVGPEWVFGRMSRGEDDALCLAAYDYAAEPPTAP